MYLTQKIQNVRNLHKNKKMQEDVYWLEMAWIAKIK